MNIFNKYNNRLDRVLLVIRAIIWIAPVILVGWVVSKNFVFSGNWNVTFDVTKGSPFIKNFASKESDRLIGTKNQIGNQDFFQLITTSPLYFNVKAPRTFKKATFTVTYQNPNNQKEIKLGIKQANGAYHYVDVAFKVPELDNLPSFWSKVSDGNIVLWQKDEAYYKAWRAKQDIFIAQKKKLDDWRTTELKKISSDNTTEKDKITNQYEEELARITKDSSVDLVAQPALKTIDDFFNHIPDKSTILQYNYDISKYYELPGYVPSQSVTKIEKSIRGKQEIFTYLGKNEMLDTSFTIQDINRHNGPDNFHVFVYNRLGTKVAELTEPDDGEIRATGIVNPERTVRISKDFLPFGVYRIVIDTNDDVFIKRIESLQHNIVFKNSIYLTDNVEYQSILGSKALSPTVLYTSSNKVAVLTAHANGFQEIRIGNKEVTLNETHVLKEVDNLQGITTIYIPKNDTNITGEGYFAFSKDQLFDPNYGVIPNVLNVESVNDYNFIVAKYPQAEQRGEWLIAQTTVEAPFLYFNDDNGLLLNCIYSFPNLPELSKKIKIKELTITFESDPITIHRVIEKIKQFIRQ